MLPLDHPRWKALKGGYRLEYDASVPLRRLFGGRAKKKIWDELWLELEHQGDVGSASYAAVPHLLEFSRTSPRLDWNAFGLTAIIELDRPSNPKVPKFLADAYFKAIEDLPRVVACHPQQEWDELLTQNVMACIALARGQRVLATAYMELSLDAAKKWLQDEGGFYLKDLERRQKQSLPRRKS